MPDMTMCLDKKCPKRKKCYRFNAEVSPWQSYFLGSPRKNNKCEHFLKEK